MRDSQHYSRLALRYIREGHHPYYKADTPQPMITYGDLDFMEALFELFGGKREKAYESSNSFGGSQHYRFQYVMNKLDRESKKPDAIFEKGYICYNGIINRPTRCFTLKDPNTKY